ncbi:MAG: disulfide bond formation protein DsbA [SAR86 cluster bacterium]|uniref:Thiol:disulfide interchange protein n=1 Tax=SAR86 cluster bacterium TaxID=2030880 RepID=A0A2A4X182_9GAMM|nr:MAG: disulfide bond formation protein DsbA [SAR86 cluster bacterium]
MKPRLILNSIVMLLSLNSLNSFAQAERYIAGTHYKVLEAPVRTADADKIEVLEIFWYGCPGCYTFEPILSNWVENREDDIDFVRFPGVFNPLMKVHAQIFYMSQALGILAQTHDKVFDALVPQRKTLSSEPQIVDQFVEFGMDRIEVEKAFNSFAVRTKTNQAEKLTRDYKPTSTPSMVVDGKYLVSLAGPVNTYQEMLRVVDFLTEKERN